MSDNASVKVICADCGPAPVNHFSARTAVILGFLIKTLTLPLAPIEDAMADFLYPKLEPLAPQFFKFFTWIGLARITDKLEDDNIERTKCMWRAAEERGIKMRQVRLLNRPTIIFLAEFKGQKIAFEGLPRPRGNAKKSLEWMDNKAIMRLKFMKGGIPVAEGGVTVTEEGARTIFRRLEPPLIVKPNLGSRSRHTTTHIVTEEGLIKAFRKAKQLSPWVVIEEELSGFVHRITLIGGRLAGALRREPPFVIGDGAETVRSLVIRENANPKRHNGVFHEIEMGDEAAAELSRQGLAWDSVPEKGRFVALNQKVGRGQGGSNTEMLSQVHPDNVKLFEKIGEVLGDPLVGVDFIIQDVTKPWIDQRKCGAIECNSLPFLDLHHAPLRGESLDPSGALWDIVFPKAKKKQQKA